MVRAAPLILVVAAAALSALWACGRVSYDHIEAASQDGGSGSGDGGQEPDADPSATVIDCSGLACSSGEVVCPAGSTTCIFDCPDNGSCAADLRCEGTRCIFRCGGSTSCSGDISCADSADCSFECTDDGSCAGTRSCDLQSECTSHCCGIGACSGGVVCNSASTCSGGACPPP